MGILAAAIFGLALLNPSAKANLERPVSWSHARASWYEDGGATASGFHATYGVATCGNQTLVCFRFGTKVAFSYRGRSVIAVVDDHGPYANGAAFDLNQNVAAALHFSGVDVVSYRMVR